MLYTIYQTTNTINQKIYVGCHKTGNPHDDYMGSGKLISRAISKHGADKFVKEILHIFDNEKDMFAMEAEIVNEEFVNRGDTYNINCGGYGGFDYINSSGINTGNLEALQLAAEAQKKLFDDPDWLAYKNKQISKGIRNFYENGGVNPFKGKEHSTETKAHLSKVRSGKGNSQYGTCWINNSREVIKIHKEQLPEYLTSGWKRGRKLTFLA